jgi:hypothetical protein
MPADSSCHHHGGHEDVAQADQVVGDHVQPEHGADIVPAPQLELAQAAELFRSFSATAM